MTHEEYIDNLIMGRVKVDVRTEDDGMFRGTTFVDTIFNEEQFLKDTVSHIEKRTGRTIDRIRVASITHYPSGKRDLTPGEWYYKGEGNEIRKEEDSV